MEIYLKKLKCAETITTVGNQVWSDAVVCPELGLLTNEFGTYFNFEQVLKINKLLEGTDWRVPTREDFIALDKALGGTGNNCVPGMTQVNKYLNIWGGKYGGYCNSNGLLSYRGNIGFYWSSSEHSATDGYSLTFDYNGYVTPQNGNYKYYGFMLRLIKN